jgi:type II secretory pathway pseudopilin PulG
MLNKFHSIRTRNRDEALSIVEVIVSIFIIVIVLTFTAVALTASFANSDASQNLNKAYQLINKQFSIAQQVSYDKLGIVPGEGTSQINFVNGVIHDNDTSKSRIEALKCASQTTYAAAGANGDAYQSTALYKNELRVNLLYSNSGVSGVFDNTNGDPNSAPGYPVYCAYYQFGNGFGGTTTDNGASVAKGVGTIFVVETDVTWVGNNGYGSDGSACQGANSVATNGCLPSKRVSVTVKWVENDANGNPHVVTAHSSFIRSPRLSECIPQGGNGFSQTQGNVPVNPTASETESVPGVSCYAS